MDKVNKRISALINLCFGMMGALYVVVAIIGLVKWYAGVIVPLIATINIASGMY